MNKEERIGMYTSDEIYEELANGFLQRSMVDAMYFKIKDLQQRIDKAYNQFYDMFYHQLGYKYDFDENDLKEIHKLEEILGGKE